MLIHRKVKFRAVALILMGLYFHESTKIYGTIQNALDTSSLDVDKTVTIMTGENDKQSKMINSIPVIDEVEDPIKDDQVKNPIINLNGEV